MKGAVCFACGNQFGGELSRVDRGVDDGGAGAGGDGDTGGGRPGGGAEGAAEADQEEADGGRARRRGAGERGGDRGQAQGGRAPEAGTCPCRASFFLFFVPVLVVFWFLLLLAHTWLGLRGWGVNCEVEVIRPSHDSYLIAFFFTGEVG